MTGVVPFPAAAPPTEVVVSEIDAARAVALADRIRKYQGQMHRIGRIAAARALDIGRDLIDLKNVLPHGSFLPWLKNEAGEASVRTWQRWMAASERFEDNYDSVSHLPTTVIHKLAAPSVPHEARRAVIADIKAGHAPDSKKVTAYIEDAKFDEEQAERVRAKAEALARETPRQRKTRAQKEAEQAEEKARHKEDMQRREDGRVELLAILDRLPNGPDLVRIIRQIDPHDCLQMRNQFHRYMAERTGETAPPADPTAYLFQ
jgi:hypothetical protein